MRRAADAEVLAVLHRHNASPYSAVGNGQLLDRVPEPLRLVHYTRRAIPAEYAASFGYYHRKIGDVHLDGLPEPMQRELMFVVWRIVELGGRVPCGPLGLLARELAATAARLRDQGQSGSSLLDRTPAQWRTELATTWARRTKALPNPNTLRTIAGPLDRACKLLWFGYDQSPWWRREVWDPVMDDRIPRRDHEPISNTVHWHRIDPAWLRLAAMWQLKTLLETDRLRWATVETRHSAMVVFSRWVRSRGLDSPLLCDDPAQLRPLMLDLLDDIRSAPAQTGCRAGQRRAPATVAAITAAVRGLYAFIHDHREDAARATGDRRWLELGPEYLRFWRPMDMPRKQRRHFDERHLFSDRALAQISQHAHRLGQPRSAGGLGDPQGMRLLLLMIATGRRVNELCMLDVHPIIPVAASSRGDAGVAKLRYQQTKIAGAPDTIFVDNEVVEIIAEQRRWLFAHLRATGCPDEPRYLFVRLQQNRRGRQHYAASRLRHQLLELATLADLRDGDRPLRITATHRFRHTKATSLLNAGVPLHVVQRYLGHTSPEMSMHYAQTLDATAKAEFLRYRKITTDGDAAMSSADLFDLLALDTRTDRVLPNGWCSLPPARSCDKGNACLTCDLFVTDRRFLSVHREELTGLGQLVDKRQAAHEQRTGQPMPDNHVWLTIRRREQGALESIIARLEADPEVVGAGEGARVERDTGTPGTRWPIAGQR
jgi:integrase